MGLKYGHNEEARQIRIQRKPTRAVWSKIAGEAVVIDVLRRRSSLEVGATAAYRDSRCDSCAEVTENVQQCLHSAFVPPLLEKRRGLRAPARRSGAALRGRRRSGSCSAIPRSA
eukprot:2815180-Pleurochrysis_carterae.AAC.2